MQCAYVDEIVHEPLLDVLHDVVVGNLVDKDHVLQAAGGLALHLPVESLKLMAATRALLPRPQQSTKTRTMVTRRGQTRRVRQCFLWQRPFTLSNPVAQLEC